MSFAARVAKMVEAIRQKSRATFEKLPWMNIRKRKFRIFLLTNFLEILSRFFFPLQFSVRWVMICTYIFLDETHCFVLFVIERLTCDNCRIPPPAETCARRIHNEAAQKVVWTVTMLWTGARRMKEAVWGVGEVKEWNYFIPWNIKRQNESDNPVPSATDC